MTLPTPVYDHEGITLYQADCREVLPSLVAGSVDMVWVDPPYGNNNNNGDLIHRREAALGVRAVTEEEKRPIENDGQIEAESLWAFLFPELNRLLAPGACCCCCGGGGGPRPIFGTMSLMLDQYIGFKQAVVWDKGGLGMGWHYRRSYEFVLVAEKPGAACRWYGGNTESNVVRIPKIIPQADDHPTPKPVALIQHFLRLHTQPGDLVLDPCMGAGPAAEACLLMGRRYIGIELDPQWIPLAINRLQTASLFPPASYTAPQQTEQQEMF